MKSFAYITVSTHYGGNGRCLKYGDSVAEGVSITGCRFVTYLSYYFLGSLASFSLKSCIKGLHATLLLCINLILNNIKKRA